MGWYACDFDGTLVTYDKWVGPEHAGEPIMRTVRRVRHWLRKGRDVRIFTARVSWTPDDANSLKERDISIKTINEVCLKCFGKTLPITYEKDYHMVTLLDDRCLQVFPNTGELVQERLRKAEEKLAELKYVYVDGHYQYDVCPTCRNHGPVGALRLSFTGWGNRWIKCLDEYHQNFTEREKQ